MGNAIKTCKEKMVEKVEAIWEYAQSIADEEDRDSQPPEFKQIDKDQLTQIVKEIDKIFTKNPKVSTKSKAKLRYIQKNFVQNLDKYEKQQEILKERRSYSKTDLDVNFMPMKDDHVRNGQLRPTYNVQVSFEFQSVVHYTQHQTTNDIATLKPHLETFEYLFGFLPEQLTANATYDSEDNFEFLEQKVIILK